MLKAKTETSISLSTPESMEEDTPLPRSPFWIQTTTNVNRIQRYRLRLSSLFFNSFVLIIFLLLFAVLSMVFIIPSVIDFSSQIFKPNLVKRSWDSVNLLLVLFALVIGFLSRNIDNGYDRGESEISTGIPVMSPASLTPHHMYDIQEQEMNSVIGLRRQRTSSSYPDLRELSLPWNHRGAGVDPWRFSDDTHLNYYRVLESNPNYIRRQSRRETYLEIQEKSYTPPLQQSETPSEMPSLPPQAPAHTVKKKTKRVHHNVATEDGDKSGGSGTVKILSPGTESSEQKGRRSERKRGNGEKRRARSSEPRRIVSLVIDPLPETSSPVPISPVTVRKGNGGNATKDFFTSFYNKKKKKLQRGRSVDNLGVLFHHSQPPAVNLLAPPAPPPPPPRTANRAPRPTITRVAPFVTDKPRVPLMMTSFNGIDDSSSGGESPMKQIPPPPPLPPFKMPDWKFTVEGDFVRLQSTLSSRSVSPDGDEAQSPSSDVEGATAVAAPVFFPSSDVDTIEHG